MNRFHSASQPVAFKPLTWTGVGARSTTRDHRRAATRGGLNATGCNAELNRINSYSAHVYESLMVMKAFSSRCAAQCWRAVADMLFLYCLAVNRFYISTEKVLCQSGESSSCRVCLLYFMLFQCRPIIGLLYELTGLVQGSRY